MVSLNTENYLEELEFVFVDLVRHAAKDLSAADVKTIVPLLQQASLNGNYEAALVLGIYFDPDGCLFPSEIVGADEKSFVRAKENYERAYALAVNSSSPRSKNMVDYVSQILDSH